MSPSKNRKALRSKITNETIAEAVSKALRREHTELSAAVKLIERITGIGEETASKWYRGLHAPESRHLLMLGAYYPEVLLVLCELMERDDVWEAAARANIPFIMRLHLTKRYPSYPFRGDMRVTPSAPASSDPGMQSYDRQVWFLEQLKAGRKLQTKDIILTCHVSKRTAKRDIAELKAAEKIRFVKDGKSGWYEIL